ncbi:hypothetical protein EON64_13990, partial [archaeon]
PNLIPNPYGYLEYGLASPVVDPSKLASLAQERGELFDQFKCMIADTSNDRARTAWFFETIDHSTFVCYKHSKLLLGTSRDAKVYLGGYLAGQHASDDRDVVRQRFAQHAQPVAIKQFFEPDTLIEISGIPTSAANLAGTIKHLARFEVGGVEQYSVQELGLVSLDKIFADVSFEERLKTARGVCLAVRELHEYSGGPIVHRDIRLSNILLLGNGCFKMGDSNISRTLSDPKHALGIMSYQPFEVQVAVQRQLEERQTAKLVASASDPFELDIGSHIPATTSGDIFMLGLVIYKLVTKLDAMTTSDIVGKKATDLSVVIGLFAGGEMLAHLLSCMLSHEAARRPTIDQVLGHPFFKSWNENEVYVHSLFTELHNINGVPYTENFKVLEIVLRPLEQQANWPACLQNLPPELRSRIEYVKDVPPVLLPDGSGNKAHPLPNLHGGLQFLCQFFVQFTDEQILPFVLSELRAALQDQEAAGEFVYTHPSLCWLLPKLWETKVYYLQHLQQEQQVWERDWALLQRRNEQVRSRLSGKERKIKSLLGTTTT